MLALLALLASASAHGTGFGVTAIRPVGPEAWWALLPGLGAVLTEDGGATYTYACDEALGESRVYDILPIEGALVVAGLDGLHRAGDCAPIAIPGLPEGAVADHLAPADAGFVTSALGVPEAGLYTCTLAGCTPSDTVAEGLIVKSILATDAGLWATTVTEPDLAARLLWSADGRSWEPRFDWPAGDLDPRALLAVGDALFVWAQPRAEGQTGALLRSEDGGRSFAARLDGGALGDAIPGMAAVDGGATLLIGLAGGQTFASTDGGDTWVDQSDWMPEVACGATLGEDTLLCADHILDGVDIFRTSTATRFEPASCLEEATVAPCAAENCAAEAVGYESAAELGGGRCEEVRRAPTPEDADEEGKSGGCAGGLPLLGLLIGLGRRRSGPAAAEDQPHGAHIGL